MVDSSVVLWGQTIAYTLYCTVIILLMTWFSLKVTKGKSKKVKPGLFYGFVIFLAVLGVSLHIVTFNTIPWVPMDINRADIPADRKYEIRIEQHRFILPEARMVAKVNEKVLFNVTSADLTYGFGLFRKDNTMVMQMQVVPGHTNDILWQFEKPGVYTIRSTEYSGPDGIGMIEKDVFEVIE